MAILTQDENEIEVRIKRHPEKTYFAEHVKVGDREKPGATSCERYIVPEPGATYSIEVTLKKGYAFGGCEAVNANLFVPGFCHRVSKATVRRPKNYQGGTKEDIVMNIEHTDMKISGQKLLGAELAFKELHLGTVNTFNSHMPIY